MRIDMYSLEEYRKKERSLVAEEYWEVWYNHKSVQACKYYIQD
jgi:hypothetical protein